MPGGWLRIFTGWEDGLIGEKVGVYVRNWALDSLVGMGVNGWGIGRLWVNNGRLHVRAWALVSERMGTSKWKEWRLKWSCEWCRRLKGSSVYQKKVGLPQTQWRGFSRGFSGGSILWTVEELLEEEMTNSAPSLVLNMAKINILLRKQEV